MKKKEILDQFRGIDGDVSPSYFYQDDEVAAHICTPPVFDDGGGTAPVFDDGGGTAPVFEAGGCIDIVFATIDCTATANLQNPDN